LALAAAQEIVGAEGLRGLSARRVVGRIGYVVGPLCFLFENLDELVLRLNVSTLHSLFDALSAKQPPDEPKLAVMTLAHGYGEFTRSNPNLWNALIDHRLLGARALSKWCDESVFNPLGLLERAISSLFPSRQVS